MAVLWRTGNFVHCIDLFCILPERVGVSSFFASWHLLSAFYA